MDGGCQRGRRRPGRVRSVVRKKSTLDGRVPKVIHIYSASVVDCGTHGIAGRQAVTGATYKMQVVAFLLLLRALAFGFRPLPVPLRTSLGGDGRGPLLNGLQSSEGTEVNETKSKRRRIPVLQYRDDYVIVSKPPGMTMHHNSKSRWGRSKSPVLQAAVKRQLGRKPYLVHRLDHRTSGACIVGFSSEAAGSLHGRLRSEDACKLYVALVRGNLRDRFRQAAETGFEEEFVVGAEGSRPRVGLNFDDPPYVHSPPVECEYRGKITINQPIKDNEVDKDAVTDFFFLSSLDMHGEDDENDVGASSSPYTNKSISLLLCRPRTGRSHQIRKHLKKALNCPIIGDSEHGDSRVNRHWRQTIGLDRLALHCFYLGLPSVRGGGDEDDDEIQCIAPLTDDLRGALLDGKLAKLWEEATHVEPKLKKEFVDERGGSFGRHFRKRKNEQQIMS
mmetsp:Transcript_19785/g.45323  ORF Transcript_19785/g.45323 Transcript_19785/m.45323 type:complete len:446 (-) Transcript_19785:3-1340(-)